MSQPQIKLQKLPDTKPTKHTISVMPDLEADLEATTSSTGEKRYGYYWNIQTDGDGL